MLLRVFLIFGCAVAVERGLSFASESPSAGVVAIVGVIGTIVLACELVSEIIRRRRERACLESIERCIGWSREQGSRSGKAYDGKQ